MNAPDLCDALDRGNSSFESVRQVPATAPDAFVCVEWWRPLFFHFEIERELLRRELPAPFELDLHDGHAIVSLVALAKRRFRPNPQAPLWTWLLPLLPEQRFLNLRSYVRYRGEPGAFFIWGWLSRPLNLPLPKRPFGLSCAFAQSKYRHHHQSGRIEGTVSARGRRFAWKARIDSASRFAPCPCGSLGEFALERYAAWFWHQGSGFCFRAEHSPWNQMRVAAQIDDDTLITDEFPWFRHARLVEANYASGFDDVWLSKPLPLIPARKGPRNPHGPSALFEMP